MDKAKRMQRLFSGAPARYDGLLSRLTLRSDSEWRKAVIESSLIGNQAYILDIATGTGLMAFDFANELNHESMVVGVDLCEPMLRKGIMNMKQNGSEIASFVLGRAEALPFIDGCFDCATITLALRNVTDPRTTFAEMARVVKERGLVISMDFSRPLNRVFRRIYYFHISYVLPFIGRLVSVEWREIFEYLAGSIKKSMDPIMIRDLMRAVGLSNVRIRRMSMGIASLVTGSKSTGNLSSTDQSPNH